MKAAGRVLVPVCGASQDRDALELACLLARRRKVPIEAVFVIEVDRSLPLDAEMQAEIERGETALQSAENVARAMEVGFESSLLQARDVGAAIVDEGVQNGVGVVVMGLPYKRRFGEYDIGRTAQYVLKNAPCAVCLTRQPMSA